MGRDQDEALEFGMSADEKMQRALAGDEGEHGVADEMDLGDLDDFDPLADLGI